MSYNVYKKRLVPKILVSGGINRITGENEGLLILKKLINLGVNKIIGLENTKVFKKIDIEEL